MTIFVCSYCRRTNDHVGVCDGCSAPLPAYGIVDLRAPLPAQGYWTTSSICTYPDYATSSLRRLEQRDHEMGVHNRRLRDSR